jgi:hypothetical protein
MSKRPHEENQEDSQNTLKTTTRHGFVANFNWVTGASVRSVGLCGIALATS